MTGGPHPDWLETIGSARFRAETFGHEPHAEPSSAGEAAGLLTWDLMARLLTRPDADVIVSRDGGHLPGARPRDLATARRLFASGCSFFVRDVHRADPGLAGLAERFASFGPVAVHAVSTPLRTRGFGWHYDVEDVFFLQCAGVKEMFLRPNTVHPEPTVATMPADLRYEEETSDPIACTLLAGDWLYIPRGWWHHPRSHDDSLSLSIGVLSAAARGESG